MPTKFKKITPSQRRSIEEIKKVALVLDDEIKDLRILEIFDSGSVCLLIRVGEATGPRANLSALWAGAMFTVSRRGAIRQAPGRGRRRLDGILSVFMTGA